MSQNSLEQIDVLIVGAGMVGLTLANALAPSNLKIKVLEQRAVDLAGLTAAVKVQQAEGFDPRVSALTCASQQILTEVGAWPLMQSLRVSPYTGMDVWDGEGTGQIQFFAQELHEPCLGHIVENRVTLAGLVAAVQQHDNVEVLTNASLVSAQDQGRGRLLRLQDSREFQASLLVAADGAQSNTRRLVGLPMVEWDYNHQAIVTTVETEQPHQATAWQRFTDDGPLALLPLTDDQDGRHFCSIVWSTSPEQAKNLMAMDAEAFNAALTNAFEQRLGNILWSDQRMLHPLRQRHAQHYVAPGFATIGDAAHTIHPLAGQGVNLGLLDAAQLAEVLLEAAARGESLSDTAVLRRYQRLRQSENLKMTAMMEGFKRLFNSRQPLLQLARNMGMNLLNDMKPVKNHIVLEAMGLSGRLPAIAKRPIKP